MENYKYLKYIVFRCPKHLRSRVKTKINWIKQVIIQKNHNYLQNQLFRAMTAREIDFFVNVIFKERESNNDAQPSENDLINYLEIKN